MATEQRPVLVACPKCRRMVPECTSPGSCYYPAGSWITGAEANSSNLVAEAMAAAHQYIFKMEWRDDETHKRAIEICGALTKAIHALPDEMSCEWRPIATADTNQLFASSTWVLIQRDDGFVTEAMPHYFSAGGYIWMTARGDNCRGSPDEHSGMLRHDVTHWRPLPSPLKTNCSVSAPRDLEDGVDELDPPA